MGRFCGQGVQFSKDFSFELALRGGRSDLFQQARDLLSL